MIYIVASTHSAIRTCAKCRTTQKSCTPVSLFMKPTPSWAHPAAHTSDLQTRWAHPGMHVSPLAFQYSHSYHQVVPREGQTEAAEQGASVVQPSSCARGTKATQDLRAPPCLHLPQCQCQLPQHRKARDPDIEHSLLWRWP